jgi:hypothetical protein
MRHLKGDTSIPILIWYEKRLVWCIMIHELEQKQRLPMSTTSVELDELINAAVKKVGARKENDLCHYLPMSTGGYMHHFTMRKMKHQGPDRLAEMINQYIIKTDRPLTVTPKQRAARGSRKKKGQVVLSGTDLERLINLVRTSGDKDMVKKLLPQKELKVIKRELIQAIKQNRVDLNLWNSFVESVTQ